MDVFFYEAFAEEEEALARVLDPSISCGYARETIQESGHTDPPAKLISIRTQSEIPASWAGRINGILSRTTGFDHLLLLKTSFPATIPLGYLEEYATRAVAEQAMMLVMALLRKLPMQMHQFDRFDRDGLTGAECKGKRLLVVGVGRIGYELSRIARGLGMEVEGVDIVQKHPDIQYTTREEGISRADAVVCCMNLTPENKGYFSASLLRKAKQGVVFVNVARGEHSPLQGLQILLAEGHLGGLGLDVFEHEPSLALSFRVPSGIPTPGAAILREILTFPNVVCTPHNAFNTTEAIVGKAAFTVSQVNHFLKQGDFLWRV